MATTQPLAMTDDAAASPATAIIFANGDAGAGAMVARVLESRGSALIIAADGGAHNAMRFGVFPQHIIGDMDSVGDAYLSAFEARGAVIHRYPEEKNETDLELALVFAAGAGARAIRVIGAVGDRLDQTLSNVYLMALPSLAECDVRLVSGKQAVWLIGAGQHTIHGMAGDTVSLLPLNGTVQGVTTDGLYYPLRDEALSFGPARGVSNVLQGERALVTVRMGVLLVVHTVGRA